jgi:hypothetical protein
LKLYQVPVSLPLQLFSQTLFSGVAPPKFFMHQDLLSPTTTLDPNDTEVVLVEAPGFSEDEEILKEEGDRSDFTFDEDDCRIYESFEDDEDDIMKILAVRDLNTLSHLYRFGLSNTARRNFSLPFVAEFQRLLPVSQRQMS